MIKIKNNIDSILKKKFLEVFLILFFLFFTLSSTQASINKQINYQGKLFNSNEQPVNDGDYNIEFRLCTTSDCSGGSDPIWTETRTGGNRVTVKNGLFSVLLGEVSSIASVDFNQDLWLGVNIGGTGATPSWDGEMTPRKKLGAVNASIVSASLKSDVAGNEIVANSANNLLEITQSGTGDIFRVNDVVGDTSPFLIDASGNVGIGDATPDALLDVAGSFRLDGTFGDKDGDVGTSGQILSSTATGVDWVDLEASNVSVSDTGGYYDDTDVEAVLQNLGKNATDRWSTGLVSGGGLSDAGGVTIDIAAGEGFINNSSNQLKEISWNAISGVSMTSNGDNYVYIDSSGSAHITSSEENSDDYILLGYVYTIQTNTDIGLLSSNPYLAGNYTKRNNKWLDKVMGPMIEDGNIVSEHTTNLELSVTSGKISSRLSDYTTSATTTITKWYNSADYGWYKDSSTPNKVNPNQYNDPSLNHGSALVNMTVLYWKKDLIVRALDGSVHYIYGQAEYDTEQKAKESPLPQMPDCIAKCGAVYLATIVSQQGSTSIANNIYDIRPNMDRVFGSGVSGTTGSAADHGDLTGLLDDDHLQYLRTDGGRVVTGNMSFEGSTADNFETLFSITDPTADRTITFPNLSGEVSLLGQTIGTSELENNIPLSKFSDDATHRLVTDVEKSTWNAKENAITTGTNLQFWRGDKTWQTLDTSVVPENGNLYFTNARADARADLRIALASIDDLSDVNTAGVSNGQVLEWNGSDWVVGNKTSNTDDQQIETFSLTNGVLSLALEDDGQADQTVDFSNLYTFNSPLSLSSRTVSLNYDDDTIGVNGSNQIYVKDDGIDDTKIDWGTGVNQVSAEDILVQDSGSYYTQTNTESVLQHIGSNANKRWSTGLISGGGLSDNGDNDINIAAGTGFVNNSTNKLREVSWSAVSDENLPYSGDNYIYMDVNGSVHITATESNIDDYIYLGYAYTISGNTDIGLLSSNPFYAGNYTNRNNKWMEAITGVMVESGNIVSEQATNLKLSISSGTVYSRLSEYNLSSSTTFTKWYNNGGTWTQDTSNPNTVSTSQYNNTASGLVNLTSNYWKKDLVLRTLDGNVHYIYAQAEYSTEDSAKEGALPTIPTSIEKAGAAFLATIVSQQGDTSISNRLYDVRPNMDRVFGYGTSGTTGTVADHGALTGLSDDDHPQYLLVSGSRAMTGNLNLGTNAISNVTSLTMAGTLKNTSTTSPQLNLGYDASNYFTTSVASNGLVTLDAFGTGAGFTFSDNVRLSAGLLDTSGDTGTSGQILSSTATGTNWIDSFAPSAGTTNNNTLRWNGTAWVESSALQNDGTDVTVSGDVLAGSSSSNLGSATQGFDNIYSDLTQGSALFIGANGLLSEDNSNFFWDDTNNRLGLGTNSSDYTLDVAGEMGVNRHIYHNGDSNTYIDFTPDRIRFYAGGRSMIDMQQDNDDVVFNEGSTQTDFRFEGGTEQNLLFLDGSADMIGIATNAPSQILDVVGNIELNDYLYFRNGSSEYLRHDGSTFVMSDDLLPSSDDSLDLGTTGSRWQDLYLGPQTLHIGSSLTDEGLIGYNTTNNILTIDTDATTAGDIAFNTDDLFIDTSSSRVGIGDTTPDATLDVAGSLRVDGEFYDKDGDAGTAGQVLASTATGVDWITNSSNPVPYISTTTRFKMQPSSTRTFTLEGVNFLPTTAVSITNPAFSGTVDSVNVLSPTEMEVTVTSTATEDVHDIVLSNSGVLNTVWTGNGVDLFEVVTSTWVDLRAGGDALTDGNGAGNDIRYRSGMSMSRDANGMWFTGANPWSSWVKFESLGWTRGTNQTLSWVFTGPDSAMMIGIGSDATNESGSDQYRQAEVEIYFNSSTNMWGLYGNNGTVGSAGNQSHSQSLSGCASDVFKGVFEDDGDAGDTFTLYCLPSANQSDWDNTATVMTTFSIGGSLNPDESNIMPFIIPRNGGAQRFIAVKVE